MNINVTNSAAMSVPPVRVDKSNNVIPLQQSKNDQVKLSENNQILNSSKSNPVKNIRPEYSNTAPVSNSKNTLKTLFEAVQREIPGSNKKTDKVESNDNESQPGTEKKPEIVRKELGKGFFVTVPGEKKTEDKSNNPRLDAHKNLVNQYFINQRFDTGRLMDMFL